MVISVYFNILLPHFFSALTVGFSCIHGILNLKKKKQDYLIFKGMMSTPSFDDAFILSKQLTNDVNSECVLCFVGRLSKNSATNFA